MALTGFKLDGYREIQPVPSFLSKVSPDEKRKMLGYPWIEPIRIPSKCPKCGSCMLDAKGNKTENLKEDEHLKPKKIKDIETNTREKFRNRIREVVLYRVRYKCNVCGKRFYADTPEMDSQLRYTKRFLDAAVSYALQYGYTHDVENATGLSQSTLTRYVNAALDQKYQNRSWYGAKTIALYTQKFFDGKKILPVY